MKYTNIQTQLVLRNSPAPADRVAVADILTSSGYFYDYEIAVAEELVCENLEKGAEKSGYNFIFADNEDRTIGFTCFGPIACTESSYDLYWIAVHKDVMFQGLGKRLIKETEEAIRKMGGTRVYIETSGRELYKSTRDFYIRSGYLLEAELKDFYGKGDSKLIYVREL
jgi:GNAT superfamily N-acetyltransferase